MFFVAVDIATKKIDEVVIDGVLAQISQEIVIALQEQPKKAEDIKDMLEKELDVISEMLSTAIITPLIESLPTFTEQDKTQYMFLQDNLNDVLLSDFWGRIISLLSEIPKKAANLQLTLKSLFTHEHIHDNILSFFDTF